MEYPAVCLQILNVSYCKKIVPTVSKWLNNKSDAVDIGSY